MQSEVSGIQTIAVLESGNGVQKLLREKLDARHFRLAQPTENAPLHCALLVVTPDWCGEAPQARCRILLTPSGKAAQLGNVRADWVVSVGAGKRESISFSSLEPDGLTLSIRREIPTLSGRVLDVQELPRSVSGGTPEEMLTACAAALLAEAPDNCAHDGV